MAVLDNNAFTLLALIGQIVQIELQHADHLRSILLSGSREILLSGSRETGAFTGMEAVTPVPGDVPAGEIYFFRWNIFFFWWKIFFL